MPQTIDYKVNVDLNEAMSTLQMVDMQMSQIGGMRGGGGYNPAPYYPTNVEQAFGDLSFSAGQFVQRFQQPLGTIRTHTPDGISSMPNINFATAATSVWGSGGLGVPHGIARYDFERYAQEQFSIQGSRAAAGGVWGFASAGMSVAGGWAGAKVGAGIGTMLGGPGIGTLVGSIAGFVGVDALLGPVKGQLQDGALLDDVIRSSSKMSRAETRGAARDITNMHLNDPLISSSDATMIAGLGAQMGLMGDAAGNAKDYLKNFRQLTKDAKEVATALGTSLQEGMAAMAQLKGAGFSGHGAAGAIDTLSGMAGGDPSKTMALMRTGMMGASAFHGTGMARTGGFWQAIGTSGAVGAAKSSGDVSGEMWAQAGGTSGVTRLMLGSNMQFQESGMGVAMQAGLWQGGTAMGGLGGGSVMDLMAGGLGGMGSGDWLSFNRNRAEGVGKMPESQRRLMEAKAQMEVAGMWADSLGGDVGDALFAMAQGRGMSTPQAQAWASSIQQTAKGGGGGGGGGARAQLKKRLVDAANERNAAGGIDAVIGEWRDTIGRAYNDTFVEPVLAIQAGIEGAIRGYVDHRGPAVGDVDTVLSSVDGNLKSQIAKMKGMDISEYSWAGNFAQRLSEAGKKAKKTGGRGFIQTADHEFYASTDAYDVLEQTKKNVDTAWGTDLEKIRSGRAGDTSRIYENMSDHFARSQQGRDGVRKALAEGGSGAALAHMGASTNDPSQLAAGRAVLEHFYGRKIDKEDFLLEQHHEFAVIAGKGQAAAGDELRGIIGLGDRGKWDRYWNYDQDGLGADRVWGTKDDPLWSRLERYSKSTPGGDPTKRQAGGLRGPAHLASVVAKTVSGWGRAVGIAASGEDEERRMAYAKFAPDVIKYMEDAKNVTTEEREMAERNLVGVKKTLDSFGAKGTADIYEAKLQAESKRISATRGLDDLQSRIGGDRSSDPILSSLRAQTEKERDDTLGAFTLHVKESGGVGPQAKKKSKTIVPIAMGIDATDRDLYNAVSSLYRSVQALHGKIVAVPATGTKSGEEGFGVLSE